MKMIATAMALAFALPAAAQTAPMSQHQDHRQMQHGQMPMQHGQHAGMADCCADRNGNGRMDCCENMEQGDHRDCCQEHRQQPAQPQAHQNH